MQKAAPAIKAPDEWVRRHAQLIPAGGRVLDLACGSGRHSLMLAGLGLDVLAVDRDVSVLQSMRPGPAIELLEADLETPEWPLEGIKFAGIVVVNYLYRPHLQALIENLRDDGVLIYSTFAAGNERFGRPRNPAYLLQPDELLDAFSSDLQIIAHESLQTGQPVPAVRQQICAAGPAFRA